ncbi:MAG: LytTR family DNA-binding domain-containing protein [Coprococcus sp.]
MKLKLLVSKEHYSQIAGELAEKGIEIDENSSLILSECNTYATYLIGRRNDEIFRLKTEDIIHIESFAHDVIAYTERGSYRINERLKTLSNLLDPQIFIRISNSVILSVNHIQSIKPAFTQKFIVTMVNGAKVDVTRTYYYIFKEFIGI